MTQTNTISLWIQLENNSNLEAQIQVPRNENISNLRRIIKQGNLFSACASISETDMILFRETTKKELKPRETLEELNFSSNETIILRVSSGLSLKHKIEDATKYLEQKITILKETKIKTGIILGSGLDSIVSSNSFEKITTIAYKEIPHFPQTTISFHAGYLIVGKLYGKYVIVMQGRFHFYEGWTMLQVTFPVRVLKSIGIETLIITNIGGGLNKQYEECDLMIIEDHINLLPNPLIGPNDDSLGKRWPSMKEPYNKELIKKICSFALTKGIKVHKGVYVAVSGPSQTTRAELEYLSLIGADVLGYSTVPEVIVANHAELKVLAISVITDMCLPHSPQLSVEEILHNAKLASLKILTLLEGILEN